MRSTEHPKSIEYQMRIYGCESGEAEFDRDLIHDSVVERHTLPFYRTIDDARLGMHEVILKAATQEATSFITYEIGDGGYPSIYAGTIDASRVEKSGIMFGNALDSFSLPTSDRCRFDYSQNPRQLSNRDLPVKVVKHRKGYRPTIFIGTDEDMKDTITRPSDQKNTNFRSFLAKLYPENIKYEDDEIMELANQLFHYFEFR